jgi:hypothetical protein
MYRGKLWGKIAQYMLKLGDNTLADIYAGLE